MKPGIYEGLSYEEYDAIDAVRQSRLKAAHVSALQYRHVCDSADKTTKALGFGRALHTKILEPEKFDQVFVVEPTFDGKPKNKLKANGGCKEDWNKFQKENEGKIFVEPSINDMAKAFANHPYTRKLLNFASVEQTLVWIDPETGLLCKGRLDAVVDMMGASVYDVKSIEKFTYWGIKNYIRDYHCKEQAAWYHDGLKVLTGEPPRVFIDIFMQKPAPHDIEPLMASEGDIDEGRSKNRTALRRIADATERGEWTGRYTNSIRTMGD